MHHSLAFACLVACASGLAPSKVLRPRSTTICGQWDTVETGSYIVYQDLWGESSGTGSQCTTVNSLSGNSLSWSTSWTWSGGSSQVKSFANAVNTAAVGVLSTISSLPTIWKWSYTGSDIVADVAYDIFTSSTASGSAEYEVMIWLAALGGAGPISSTGSTIAKPTIAGVKWNLYGGYNGNTHVFSFVAPSQVTSFNADLLDFLDYLVSNQGMGSSQYLQSVGAGTEAFTGSGTELAVAAYSLSITTS